MLVSASWFKPFGCLAADLRHRSGSVSSGTQYDGSVSAGHFGGAGSYRDISFDAAMEAGIQEVRPRRG